MGKIKDPWVIRDLGGGILYYRELIYGLCGWYEEIGMADLFNEKTARMMVLRLRRRKNRRHLHFYCANRLADLSPAPASEKGGKREG